MNDNELGFSPIRQYAHDDVGSFSSKCEENVENYVIIISLKSETMGKLIKRIKVCVF